MLGHVVVASFGEALDQEVLVDVVRLTEVFQIIVVIANRGVDESDEKVRVHGCVAGPIHDGILESEIYGDKS